MRLLRCIPRIDWGEIPPVTSLRNPTIPTVLNSHSRKSPLDFIQLLCSEALYQGSVLMLPQLALFRDVESIVISNWLMKVLPPLA